MEEILIQGQPYGKPCGLLHQLHNIISWKSVEQKQTTFIRCGLNEIAIKLTKDEHLYISELQCNQEEANTIVVLHASVVTQIFVFYFLIIKSFNTDILSDWSN